MGGGGGGGIQDSGLVVLFWLLVFGAKEKSVVMLSLFICLGFFNVHINNVISHACHGYTLQLSTGLCV